MQECLSSHRNQSAKVAVDALHFLISSNIWNITDGIAPIVCSTSFVAHYCEIRYRDEKKRCHDLHIPEIDVPFYLLRIYVTRGTTDYLCYALYSESQLPPDHGSDAVAIRLRDPRDFLLCRIRRNKTMATGD